MQPSSANESFLSADCDFDGIAIAVAGAVAVVATALRRRGGERLDTARRLQPWDLPTESLAGIRAAALVESDDVAIVDVALRFVVIFAAVRL